MAASTVARGIHTYPSGRRGRLSGSAVLLVASCGAFLAFLDATVVNVAFPSIRDSFPKTSIGDLSWVLNAYNIVFAAFLIVCGRLADLLGMGVGLLEFHQLDRMVAAGRAAARQLLDQTGGTFTS